MNLSVDAGGLHLKNPLILASASYTATASGIRTYVGLGFGAVVTKTTTLRPLAGAPRGGRRQEAHHMVVAAEPARLARGVEPG
ncbi:MAG: hypothetical protein NUW23_11950, partial [Firmicutes bacterium]|nr:hypothetical protein [Bacillota bacterium]